MRKSELKAIIKECIAEEMFLVEFKGGGKDMKRFIELTDPEADLSPGEMKELDRLIRKFTDEGNIDRAWDASGKAHYGDGKYSSGGDSLNWFNATRKTKQGKLHGQDVKALKRRIKDRLGR